MCRSFVLILGYGIDRKYNKMGAFARTEESAGAR